MKRFHVHVHVDDLKQSIRFYSALFGVEPAVIKPDYAKWMLEDPRVNFAISARGRMPGVDHLGIQVESKAELADVADRLRKARQDLFNEGATTCCYAKSEKAWVRDPSGLSWETFHTTGESTTYGEAPHETEVPSLTCCTAATMGGASSCGG
jgi:catechol 2,3-dioxygenase-like lactoylglutathione lyase family enzyme